MRNICEHSINNANTCKKQFYYLFGVNLTSLLEIKTKIRITIDTLFESTLKVCFIKIDIKDRYIERYVREKIVDRELNRRRIRKLLNVNNQTQ